MPDIDQPPAQPSHPISFLIHAPSGSTPPDDPAVPAERRIQSALDDLELTGALQRSNQMVVTAFLNPAAEARHIIDATDKEIYEVVMEAKRVREGLVIAEAGLDDIDDGPVEPAPTGTEAIGAVLLLWRYTKDLDDPFACKFETMLSTFAQWTHAKEMAHLKDTKLTQYFYTKDR